MASREKSDTAWNTPLNKAIEDMKLAVTGKGGKQQKRDEARRIAVPKRKLANKEQKWLKRSECRFVSYLNKFSVAGLCIADIGFAHILRVYDNIFSTTICRSQLW